MIPLDLDVLSPLVSHELRELHAPLVEGGFSVLSLTSEGRQAAWLTCVPQGPISSYVTAGICASPVPGYPEWARSEIVTHARASRGLVAEVLAAVAARAHRGEAVSHHAILEHALPSPTVPHLFLIPPLSDMASFPLLGHNVLFLLAVPISDVEREYAAREGTDALAALMEAMQVDVTDWTRPSIIPRLNPPA